MGLQDVLDESAVRREEIDADDDERHARIGEGCIGLPAITNIINHPYLRGLPFYLETPNELEGYGAEIALLRGVYEEKEQ